MLSFPQYFVTCCLISMLKQGSDFHFEISGYSRLRESTVFYYMVNICRLTSSKYLELPYLSYIFGPIGMASEQGLQCLPLTHVF